MYGFGPDQLLEPFLLGSGVATTYVGSNPLFAGPGSGLRVLAGLLFLQEDLVDRALILPYSGEDLFSPARQELLGLFAAMVLILTGCPGIRAG